MDFFVSIYNLQRDEKYWPNANTFDPDGALRAASSRVLGLGLIRLRV